jgi:hypothetical protein
MLFLEKHRHGSGTGRLYYINCELDDPLTTYELSNWEKKDIEPYLPVIQNIVNTDSIRDHKHIVVKIRDKKSPNEHIPESEFAISERLKDINGFIRIICAFTNDVDDDDVNKRIIVMPYIRGGSLMEICLSDETIPFLKSLIIQATLALTEAFLKYGFLHLKLHWCNVLYETTTDSEVVYEIGTDKITVPTYGHKVVITELNRVFMRSTDTRIFWNRLNKFYIGYIDLFRKHDKEKEWKGHLNVLEIVWEKPTITSDTMKTLIERINKSSFFYYP